MPGPQPPRTANPALYPLLALLAITLLAPGPLLPPASGQPPDDVAYSGDLYLQANGSLTSSHDGATPQTCLSINPPAESTRDEATFTYPLTNRSYRPLGEKITLRLGLSGSSGQPSAGSGFSIRGTLAFGNGTTLNATERSYGSSASPDIAIVDFPLPTANASLGRGPLELTVVLEGEPSAVGAPLGQDVDVQCGAEPTHLDSFPYQVQGQGAALPAGPSGGEGEPGGTSASPFLVLGASLAGSAAFLVFGVASLTGREFSQRRIHLMMGISAGLLLAIALVRLVPASLNATSGAPWTIALGLMGLYSVEWFAGGGHAHTHEHDGDEMVPHHEHGSEAEHEELLSHAGSLALVTFIVFAFHRAVGGLTLPAAFSVGQAAGLEATLGVLIHQAPGGLAAASLFLAGGWSKTDAIKGVAVLSLFNPLGAAVGLYLTTLPGVIGHLLALSAATFIFVALAEVLPEVQDGRYRWVVAGGFVAGYVLEYVVQWGASLL